MSPGQSRLFAKAVAFARSPQGQRALRQAVDYARSEQGQRQLAAAREKLAARRRPPGSGPARQGS
jgi:hypothetical protein